VTEFLVATIAGFLPVTLFALSLLYLDSYKLVRPRLLFATLAAGGVAALISLFINIGILRSYDPEPMQFVRYVAPLVEETFKASIVACLIRRDRTGFLVDAAILGFAAGAGFAIVENVYYLQVLPDARPVVWVLRGCGTAFMHGGTAAIYALVSKFLHESRSGRNWVAFLPGLVPAILLHSFFNQFFLQPIVSTLAVLLGLPPLIFFVFWRSEKALERWLDLGFDSAAELLELIHSGRFSESKVGRYLSSLTESFRGEVVADMLCFLRLHLELSLRAKGELMMRESGFKTAMEPEIREKIEELRFLERSIGRTGKLALRPFLQVGSKELWQLKLLER
jgi:RsiW-degrading membrane proteinase PrsW (M82 family)